MDVSAYLGPTYYDMNECQIDDYSDGDDKEDKIEKEIEAIVVSDEDALKFVCNAVILGDKVVLPAKCDDTCSKLAELGFKSYGVELDEFLKGGGSAKCLSLKLDQ